MTRSLPPAYAWLDTVVEPPRMIVEARKEYGVLETPGAADNPVILGWAAEVGLNKTYSADAIPWCGLFAAVVADRAGWTPPDAPLWARNWAKFGRPVTPKDAALGDVLVFVRGGGGHVGFYVGEDDASYHVLGGNQGDAVSIARILRSRCIAVRRPKWRVSQPAGVQKHRLTVAGQMSRNEA